MRLRLGLVLAMGLAVAGACAPASSGPGGGAQTAPQLEGEEIPEGIPPRNNEYTRAAGEALEAAQELEQAEEEADPTEVRRHYEQALEAAQAGIQADSTNPLSYLQAGYANLGLGNYAEADRMLVEAQDLHPRYMLQIDPLREQMWIQQYNEAITALEAGNTAQALQHFENADAIFQGRPEAMLNLGQLYGQEGEFENAIEAFEDAVEVINSDVIEGVDSATAATWLENEQIALQNMAQLHVQMGNHEAASEIYRNVLAENPDDVQALTNLAVTMVQMEQPDSARALYDQLLTRDDLNDQQYFNAGVGLYQIGEQELAAEAFTTVVERSPYHRDALQSLVQTLALLEDNETVLPHAQRLLELDPRNDIGNRVLARALLQTGDEDAGMEVYEEGQAWPWVMENLQLQPRTSGGGIVQGSLQNRSLEPGSTITLEFTFYGQGGSELTTQTVDVEAPDEEMSQVFNFQVQTEERIAGYSYEVVSE